jgi:dihydropteroate synthase
MSNRPLVGPEAPGADALRWRCGGFVLALARPLVMGIVNVTPDSFSDGGRHLSKQAAVEHGLRLMADGADLVDVGGESTRPGAPGVGTEEELRRVLPVIEALAAAGAIVSVDTRWPDVMRAALAAGAAIVNDVNAFQAPGALDVVAAAGCGLVAMHMRGTPETMQSDPRYGDVVADVAAFLQGRLDAFERAGVAADRIVLDPGFGFGKTVEHNYALLARLGELHRLGRPLLVGLSNKSMLGAATGRAVGERTAASVAAAVIAVERGAAIVRVHDVAATCDALAVLGRTRAAGGQPAAAARPVKSARDRGEG